jgi:hypothetical protein
LSAPSSTRALIPLAVLVLAAVLGWYLLDRSTSRPSRRPASAAADSRDAEEAAAAPAADAGAKADAASARRPAPVAAPRRPRKEVVLKAKWGGEKGQFGRKRDPESNPESPMAIAAGAGGRFAIVDQVNGRIQRYKDGQLEGEIKLAGDTVQDIALGAGGETIVLDRLVQGAVQVYGPDGQLFTEVNLGQAGISKGGGVTGVFADAGGIYVESDHDKLTRISNADGSSDPDHGQLAGRPTRDGRLLISASLISKSLGQAQVEAFDRKTGQRRWGTPVSFGSPLWHLLLLDSDAVGNIYLGADIGDEDPNPPYPITNERVVIQRLSATGELTGSITVPPLSQPDESFRPITVGDDGSIYVMAGGDDGLEVTRYTF